MNMATATATPNRNDRRTCQTTMKIVISKPNRRRSTPATSGALHSTWKPSHCCCPRNDTLIAPLPSGGYDV